MKNHDDREGSTRSIATRVLTTPIDLLAKARDDRKPEEFFNVDLQPEMVYRFLVCFLFVNAFSAAVAAAMIATW
jgi:hypothetical protein